MSRENVEEIKEKLGIVELLGSYLKLEKAGSSFKARCPFHNEKTPSFFVSPDRDTYYCFGCGKKGDIFTFTEEFEGVDFIGALKILGERAGVEISFDKKKDNSQRESLFAVLEEATVFYGKNLKKDSDSYKYLIERGLSPKTIDEWRLGYVEKDWRTLSEYLKSKNFTEKIIELAGLIKKGEKGSYYDRFRGRIIFPIFDASSRVVGFTGRILEKDDKQAKYLNSPETELFNKSKLLYGFNFAKNSIRKNDFSILVEGQTDVIMSHQAGYSNTVATSGTAITGDQLDLLGRLSKRVVIALDGDGAGFKASERAWKIALEKGMDVKIAILPEGEDPAEVIKKDPKGWKNIIKKSEHIIDFLIYKLDSENLDERTIAKRIHTDLVPYITRLPSAVEQSHFIKNIKKVFNVNEDALWKEVDTFSIEEVKDKDVKEEILEKKEKKEHSVQNRIFGIYFWQQSKKDKDINLEKLEKDLIEILGEENFTKLKKTLSDEEVVFETEKSYTDKSILKKDIKELIINLKINLLERKREYLKQKLHKAEIEKDEDKQTELMKQIHQLSKCIYEDKERDNI